MSLASYILLDRSGSMAANWSETIGAVNAYVEGLASDKATKKASASLFAFDSQEPFAVIRAGAPVKEWKPVLPSEASPRGMTPLFDAIGSLVNKIRADNPKKAAIVIVTDGAENTSREVAKDAAKAMLDDMRAKNFDVVFIGADFNAFGQSASLGTSAGQTLNMTAGSYQAAMKGLATRSALYATTGSVAEFSDADRLRAAGK